MICAPLQGTEDEIRGASTDVEILRRTQRPHQSPGCGLLRPIYLSQLLRRALQLGHLVAASFLT